MLLLLLQHRITASLDVPDLDAANDVLPRPQVCHHHYQIPSLHTAPLTHQLESALDILLQQHAHIAATQ
jgi:hypothetical protein